MNSETASHATTGLCYVVGLEFLCNVIRCFHTVKAGEHDSVCRNTALAITATLANQAKSKKRPLKRMRVIHCLHWRVVCLTG